MKTAFAKEQPGFSFLIVSLALLQECPVWRNSSTRSNQNNWCFFALGSLNAGFFSINTANLRINFNSVG